MKLACTLCGLLIAVTIVNAGPIVKRQADDLNPINEVYAVEGADDGTAIDDDRGDRDKRKIDVVKLSVANGIINFVFGKLDAFLDAKTRALASLDESNKAKNAVFGIDNTQSATGQFVNNLISQKIQAGTAGIGPLISGATTFLSTASSGIGNAIASKLGPLSSLAGGFVGGGDGGAGGGIAEGFGGILSSKIGAISGLSSGSNLGGDGGGGGGIGGSLGGGGTSTGGGISLGASAGGVGAGLNLGGFAGVGGGFTTVSTTTEDIPEFDRVHVSLDVPPPVFGGGFTLITNISKVLSSLITNSARRTQNLLEVFKPVFRGAFAIKGLPSDNPK